MPEPTRKRGRPRRSAKQPATVNALDRALDILDFLAANNGLTLSEIAERTEQSPSTLHRILNTLAARGMAEQDVATQSWHIGPATFRLGTAFVRRSRLVERAAPILRMLMDHTGETANLGVLNGDAVLFVAQVETQEPIRAFFPAGARVPLHGSAFGKALLAFEDTDTMTALLDQSDLPRLTERTLTTIAALQPDLDRIRHRGFAVDEEEHSRGMRGIAAPVFDATGALVATIGISGPAHRIGPEHIKTLGAAVSAAADDLTQALGG